MRKIVYNLSMWPANVFVKLDYIVCLHVAMTTVVECLWIYFFVLNPHVRWLLLLDLLTPIMGSVRPAAQLHLTLYLMYQGVLTPSVMQIVQISRGKVITWVFFRRSLRPIPDFRQMHRTILTVEGAL